MLQIGDDDKRCRSIKLCQLIYDRKVDSEIGFVIRKLLEEGLLINFQEQSRNKKTAIYLAVEKCDVICVKFLLQFKPNLEVKDEDGKTAVDLAESNDDKSILKALLNSIVDVVNESYVESFDFETLTLQKIEAIKSRASFKVLKLTNCPSANEVWEKLNDQGYTATFNESSHLFFIAIETNETNIQNDQELMKNALDLQRPMIVQVTSSDSQKIKIYFKDDERDFVKIPDTTQINQKDFDETILSDECSLNLLLLVAALRSNLLGHFTGDLLDTKLNANEDRKEAVDQFVRSNALCHRFCKLFDESRPQIERIVATLSFKGDQSLLALFDFPFELKDEKVKLTVYQQDILTVVDSNGCSLLMMAAKQINLDAVRLLLHCSCDFNHSDNYDNRAVDICWEMKAFDCLAGLIEAGSPYPNEFRLDKVDQPSEAHERINAMIEAINSFHESIEDGETEEVEEFIASHPNIKHAFDTNNKCALTVALESNQIVIHSLLLSEGFEPGADDEYQRACSESKFKHKIRNSHRKYFKEAFDEPHLKRLLSKFRLSFGSKDRVKSSTIIRRMFDELNEIDELIPILQICSLADKLRIVFDFNCDSVVDMDPTSGSNALGAVYPIGGFVYIGAKNHETEFFKVIGALIHELTHYAMKLTYENSCKPYDEDDVGNENRFEAITRETKKICDENPSTDEIVSTVFSLYSEELWDIELIVRVPHLLAHFKTSPKALEAVERNTSELFHFYRDQTLKDVERQSKVLLQKYLIGKINNQTGIARKIENLKVKFENAAIDLKPSVSVIASNAPQMTLAMLKQVDCDDSHIFVTLEQIAIGNILDKIAKVNAKGSSTALIVDCIGQTQKYQESLRKLLQGMKNGKTIALVLTEAESSKVKENFPKIKSETCDHKWGELTESSKVHLLKQNVIFQGVEMKLNELVEPSSEAMNFFPLGELVDLKGFKIGHELHQTSHNFYIPRKFIEKYRESSTKFYEIVKTFEELLQNDLKTGVMIISDEAGSGKSVALFEAAKTLHEAFPHRWVQFVDLKGYIKAFKSVEDQEKIESFEDFIERHILKNDPKFDRELFMQMFQAGKTFVLLDGFDEISPNYKELLLHILKLFQPGSGNQLFITTRPHLEADLEVGFKEFVFKLGELSEESQKSFLREYWRSVGFEMSQEDFEVLSRRLLKKFSEILSSQLIGLPLLLRMTAEIFEEPIKEDLSHKVDSLKIYSLFSNFVEKYFLRWTNNENEISRSENVKFVLAGGVLGVHHSIAIKQIFDDEFMSFEVDKSDAEKIARVGLIRYDKTEKTLQFIHQTFAEYFVANFIWYHLDRKNRDPSHECSKAVEVLFEVIVSYGFKANVIRTFLNQALETIDFNPSEAFCKSVAKCLNEILKIGNRFDFFGRSLYASQENLANLLLSIVKHVERNIFLKMLQSKTRSVDSVLLDAAAFMNRTIVSTLCNTITTCTVNPKEIYQDLGYANRNVLSRAAVNENIGVLTTLCINLNSFLTNDEIKIMFHRKGSYGQNIIAIASDNSNYEVFAELLSLLPNYLSPKEIKSLLLTVDVSNLNFFHRAVIYNTNESLKLKIEVVKSNFDVEDQKTFFYRPAKASNMFHCAAQNENEKIFETLIGATLHAFSGDDIKSMLMQKDSDESNVLHIIAKRGNKITLNDLNLVLRERLSDGEMRSLLLEINSWGKNCFRLAANSGLGLQVFRETIGNSLSVEDQTQLLQQSIHEIDIIRFACANNDSNEILPVETIKQLLTRLCYGRSAFQRVAYSGDVDTWNKLISFVQARFSVDEIKCFLFSCDENGENCLQLAPSRISHKNMIEEICKTFNNVLSHDDRKKMVRQKDYADRNVFLHAATRCDIFKCFSLYDGLSTILSKDEIKEMLKEKDSAGKNILRANRKSSKFVGALRELMTFLKKILTIDEIKNLFFDVDYEERNFFHCAVEFSSNSEIKSSCITIKKILNQDDQKKLFGIPNVFHLSLTNPNEGIVSTLHECLKDVLTKDEMKSLLQEKNSENENVLHSICRNGFYGLDKKLRDFLKVLKVVCDTSELKKYLTNLDNNGSNCLLLAAQFRDQLSFKELLSFVRSELSIDEQQSLTQKCDNDGHNIFKCASLNEVPEMMSVVERFTKEILSENH